MKELKDLEPGDWVFHVIDGWIKVLNNHQKSILVDSREEYLFLDGRALDCDKLPTIYTYDPINNTKRPEPEPEIDWSKVPNGVEILTPQKKTAYFIGLDFDGFIVCRRNHDGDLVSFHQAKVSLDLSECEIPKEWLKL